MHPMLNTAIKAARRAGAIINRASLDLDKIQVGRKGPNDYVTEIDRAAEQAIIEILGTAYPDHSFLAEESGEVPPVDGAAQSDYRWIIDPLDGTTNFIHGYPSFAVSIALQHRGVTTQAVIYDPSTNELFSASRGGGAFLNDRRIRVSSRTRYHDALLGVRWSSGAGPMTIPRYRELVEQCSGVRRSGSVVLDLAYVAVGRLDGFCGMELKPWDVAAAGLLVLEAGGLVSDFEGEQTWIETGNVLAGSPKIFTQMLGHLQQD